MQQNYRHNEKTFFILVKKNLANNIKNLVRPNLDYSDIIYDKPLNESFKRKIEMVQYKAALVTAGAINGTSCDRLYQELGLESSLDRRWSLRLFFFHKIIQGLFPSYLQNYHNAVSEGAYLTRSTTQKIIKPISAKNQSCIKEWSKLNDKIRNIESIGKFKVTILNFILGLKDIYT